MSSQPRIAALDGLRAVAVLFVMVAHLVTHLVPGGFGVTLFFFISGFVITRLLLQRPDETLKVFYMRRAFRILPALLTYIAISTLTMYLLRGPVFVSDIMATLLYYANYHEFHSLVLKITWSLSVEEHFYLAFPILLMALRGRLAVLQRVLVGVAVVTLAWRLVMLFGFHATDERVTAGTDTRIDSIGFGCLLSVLFERAKTDGCCAAALGYLRRPMWSWCGLVLLVASMAIRGDWFRETLRYTVQGLAFIPIFAALFYAAPTLPIADRVLSAPPMRVTGLLSYSLYLWHSLAWQVAVMFAMPPGRLALFCFGFAFVAAALSYRLVEKPFQRLGSAALLRLSRGEAGAGQALRVAP